jgi:hypothetical protein
VAQGAENDLKNITYYTNTSEIYFVDDNVPLQDLNDNILTVDNKAILAKTLANQASSDFAAHQGSSGIGVHGEATESVAGFMSAADKLKIDTISVEAQLNILSLIDSLELVSGKPTKLHAHPDATTTIDGFISTADQAKLDGIEFGANVNNFTPLQATTLTGGPSEDANLLHTHVEPPFIETFRETPEHQNEDHTLLTGIGQFTGILKSPYNIVTPVAFNTTLIEFHTFPFTPISVHAGIRNAHFEQMTLPFGIPSIWGGSSSFKFISDLSVSGNDGVVSYTASGGKGNLQVWIGGYGNS